VNVGVRSTLQVRFFAEDEVQEVIVELVVEIDEDCAWYQRRTPRAGIMGRGEIPKIKDMQALGENGRISTMNESP
jgi:hypothetical protein